MRLLALALVLVPTLAAARPITVGASLGVAQSRSDGESGYDPDDVYVLFGRVGVTERLSVQLELGRVATSEHALRAGTALLALDLGSSRTFVPMLLVGTGLARASNDLGGVQDSGHVEAGVGFEYRAAGGLVIGADVRMGTRAVDGDADLAPLADILVYPDPLIDDGEYRSARLTVGIRF